MCYNHNRRRKEIKKMDFKAIYFDMDGTIADLYSVDNWLPKLRAYDASPYAEATPLVRLCTLARMLNKLQHNGYRICVISWLSKDPNPAYDEAVTAAKLAWLAKHMPSVKWDAIHILPYGTPKSSVDSDTWRGILFDDEENNIIEWEENSGWAFEPSAIFEILRAL